MKPLTVRQMRNRFQTLIDEGHGSAIVLNSSGNPTAPRLDPVEWHYIGPSQYDSKTWTRGKGEIPGETVII